MPISLSNVRLINWHIFSDTCINIGQMTLFAGDNGSGKSTIIDAIQYGMVADLTHVKFNSAASGKSAGRTLESYCRGKIGAEELAYIRGDCISHVILQFTRKDGTFFCAGIIIEAFADGSRPSETPYLIEKIEAGAIPVYDGNSPRGVRDFREYVRSSGGSVFSSKKQYIQELTHKLGVLRRNAEYNPYLEALVRAVSFTPLNSVDQFICNYILEEKPLDVSEMKLNLENYRIAEKEATGVKLRIEKLTAMALIVESIRAEERRISLQTYLKLRLESEIALHDLEKNNAAIETSKHELKKTVVSIESVENEKRRSEEVLEECLIALGKNDSHLLYTNLTQRIESCGRDMEHQASRMNRRKLLSEQCALLLERELCEDTGAERALIEKERNGCIEEKSNATRAQLEQEKSLSQVSQEYDELSRGLLRYPDTTEELRRVFERESIPCYVFADLLEVTDDEWQNAVEGWLNTQRFNILVHEDDFQRVLEIYRSLPRSVSGVGIPNLARMRGAAVKKGSLSTVVKTLSPLAERYTAFILGDVMMADIENLKDHTKSVTRDCMRYSSTPPRG